MIKLVRLHDLQREALIRKADESLVARWHAKLLGQLLGVTEIGNRSISERHIDVNLNDYPSRRVVDTARANVYGRSHAWRPFTHDCAEYTESDYNGY